MDQKIYDEVKLFADKVNAFLPVKMIILYGSYVKGLQRPNSDIDVAVVVDVLKDNWLKVNSKLFLLSAEIDDKIEPNLIVSKDNQSEFLESIKKYGAIIYDRDRAA
jgi:predicted nucleotidyltransferase